MKFLNAIFVLVILTFAAASFAQETASATIVAQNANGIPEWVIQLIGAISSFFPSVGPILVKIATIAGIIATVATALVIAARAVFAVPELALRWAGQKEKADKILAIADKVIYYLKLVSMFNAQKKK